MEQRSLGRLGPRISVVGYGAWEAGGAQWGGPVADDRIVEAMLAGIDAGMNWIDTAEAYGDGRSEELVAMALAERPGAMVFTKVAHWVSGIDRDGVRSGVDGSLKRLGREVIDLYQIHWPNEEQTPIEEAWTAMAEVQAEGLVRCIGLSNADRDLVERCHRIRHVDAVQNQLSLLHLRDRLSLLPWLEAHGIGYLAYGPLAFGLLTGTIDETTEFDEDDWRSGKRERLGYYEELFAPGALERSLARVRRLQAIAAGLGISLPSLALRSVTALQGVTGVIAGSRSPEHTRDNAAIGAMEMDARALSRVLDAAVNGD